MMEVDTPAARDTEALLAPAGVEETRELHPSTPPKAAMPSDSRIGDVGKQLRNRVSLL